jgi:hypothetical protein
LTYYRKANTQRNALGASAIIFSLLVKMAMIGSVIEYNDKTNVANSAAYLIEIWILSLSHNFQLHNAAIGINPCVIPRTGKVQRLVSY